MEQSREEPRYEETGDDEAKIIRPISQRKPYRMLGRIEIKRPYRIRKKTYRKLSPVDKYYYQ
jgi:hypothetical protein